MDRQVLGRSKVIFCMLISIGLRCEAWIFCFTSCLQPREEKGFHAKWLRHNCNCSTCAVPGLALNRRMNVSAISDKTEIKEIEATEKELLFHFDDTDSLGHVTRHQFSFLRAMCYCDVCLQNKISECDSISKFIRMKIENKKVPCVEYEEITKDDDTGVFKWLQHIVDQGVCLIKNVPTDNEEMIVKVAEKIAYIDETNYGKMFDVKITNSINAGYTNKALALHQDLVQYENAIGFQMLHALRFDECVTGGESFVVDAFEAAEILKLESPEDFKTLTEIPVTFSTVDFDRSPPLYPLFLRHQKPHIAVDYFGKIVGVNWSPATTTPLQVREDDVDRYYKANKKFDKIINRKDIQYRFKLEVGDLLTFNNRRMLHARDTFQSNGGVRHLKGLYLKLDEVRSRYVTLAKKLNVDVVPPKMGNNSSV